MGDRIGQQLGNYRLTSLLGRGGFAEVYLGEHLYLKTPAAIKVLQNRLAGSEDLAGFLSEAQMVAHLSHPSIVRVLDFGVDGETPFLVMDYAPGGTLRQRHKRTERLELSTVTHYVEQVANALQYAHEKKVIHRDIKPENMLIGQRQEIMLSDFGIALIAQSSRYQSTQEVIGTVAYMAPEQIQGKPRPQSDQYALGIVVYEWLCGDRPFSGSFIELCTQHLFAPVPPLREKVPAISPEVEQVVITALAKDPRERFGNVQTFATALKEANQTVHAREKAQSSSPSTLLPPVPPSPPTPDRETDEQAADTLQIGASGQRRSAPGAYADVLSGKNERGPLSALGPGKKTVASWRKKAIIALIVVTLIASVGFAGALIWNSAQHGPRLTAAYQSIVSHKPDVTYTMQDGPSQQVWGPQYPDSSNTGGCTFVPQGYLLTSTAETSVDSLGSWTPADCSGSNGLHNNRTMNLLVQVTMNIQSGRCGSLAASSDLFSAELCADGTTSSCSFHPNSRSCVPVPTNTIHPGLHKDNTLALEVVAGENNQVQLIAFINGQYAVEETAYQDQSASATLFLEASTASTSVLFKDVEVWQVTNPVS